MRHSWHDTDSAVDNTATLTFDLLTLGSIKPRACHALYGRLCPPSSVSTAQAVFLLQHGHTRTSMTGTRPALTLRSKGHSHSL